MFPECVLMIKAMKYALSPGKATPHSREGRKCLTACFEEIHVFIRSSPGKTNLCVYESWTKSLKLQALRETQILGRKSQQNTGINKSPNKEEGSFCSPVMKLAEQAKFEGMNASPRPAAACDYLKADCEALVSREPPCCCAAGSDTQTEQQLSGAVLGRPGLPFRSLACVSSLVRRKSGRWKEKQQPSCVPKYGPRGRRPLFLPLENVSKLQGRRP